MGDDVVEAGSECAGGWQQAAVAAECRLRLRFAGVVLSPDSALPAPLEELQARSAARVCKENNTSATGVLLVQGCGGMTWCYGHHVFGCSRPPTQLPDDLRGAVGEEHADVAAERK